MRKIRVVELFAGVGGFRLGLEGWNGKSASTKYQENLKSSYEVIWSNQWEPSTKTQHASMVYENKWGKENHSNENIENVDTASIPNHDLLVGGFPCQDYSVATTLKNSKGLVGKKGVLWWSIYRILSEKKYKPKYLLLENVDRLLISPSKQRGRDFAIMLHSLNELGYAVEWRVINAAEYGMPQRRRRVFIVGYYKNTATYQTVEKYRDTKQLSNWLLKDGVLAKSFPCVEDNDSKDIQFVLNHDIVEISDGFNSKLKLKNPFCNGGIMIGGEVISKKLVSDYAGSYTTLGDIILKDSSQIPKQYIISDKEELKRWEYLKGSKKEPRTNSSGFTYMYTEGSMSFPEPLDKPSRTIITGEGGSSPSRFKHVIKQESIGYRRLTPIELERLDMFPDNHTLLEGITDSKRAFFMGNALVVGVVEKIGLELKNRIKE
ncbi:DNA (cytosine-5-)-methyltransferase [Bacteroides sp.]|uniref:DNA (cytosine-5-)-methyltransferase n=1 Tax=Bacteroides sp. TaxID=29523 RepID=UPI0025910680|nr:DNA (cytosine-5-)-methyltransferase [Bacteroides sp.]